MRTKWSYKVERIKFPVFSGGETRSEIIEEILNRRGLDGWELVQGPLAPDSVVSINLYLKRPS